MKPVINLRILREGKDPICDCVERNTVTFGDLLKQYPFPLITTEKEKRAKIMRTAAFPVLFVNEHTFIGAHEVENFLQENKMIDDFVSGKSLMIQMRYRVPLIERPSFYGKPIKPAEETLEHISLSADIGVPESYWDDFG